MRTEPDRAARKHDRWIVAAILLFAAILRARHLDFGLPALLDPDEPVFLMTALDMLREGRLNPGWFGHPATLLFYLLAVVILVVGGLGAIGGAWSGIDAFVAAVFADPGILVLPMRATMVALGVASVWLTWLTGRRLGGRRVGLIAAALLAANAVHVEWSQVIRTDMLATVLMGWCFHRAVPIAGRARGRDAVWAGVAAGLAGATKWPASLAVLAPAIAALWAARHDRSALRWAAIAPIVAVMTLFAVSPFLLIDHATVLRDLGGEARPVHLGATGHGPIGNLAWYVAHPLAGSFGIGGLGLAVIGAVRLVRRDAAAAMALLPAAGLILLALAGQALVWTRWIVPLLPIVAMLAALGIAAVADRIGRRAPRHAAVVAAALTLALLAVMTATTFRFLAGRGGDPRSAATAWVRAHVPPGRAVLVEHAALDLLSYRGRLLFPLGTAGCVEIPKILSGAPSHRRLNGFRQGRAIVDIGYVEPALLGSCAADVTVLSNYARYRAEPGPFGPQLANYRRVLRGQRRVAAFRGRVGEDIRTIEIYARPDPSPVP